VRGIIAPITGDWLDLVERDEPDVVALGRTDRAQPSWAEPGDPWFLARSGAVIARADFVEHELLSPKEAFDRFGYGTGGLTVEHIVAQLGAQRPVGEDELVGWISLTGLQRLRRPQGPRELASLGVELAGDDLVRLSAEQTERLLSA
jgi:hypothetical protein